jgi:hypothetical protein
MADVRRGDEGAWYLQDEDTAIVYMCAVDWEHHTLGDPAGAQVYPSEEILREARPCVSECGIVEVEMKVRRWVQKQDFNATLNNT